MTPALPVGLKQRFCQLWLQNRKNGSAKHTARILGERMPLLLVLIIILLLFGGGIAWAVEGILRIILLVILAVLIVGLITRMGRAAA